MSDLSPDENVLEDNASQNNDQVPARKGKRLRRFLVGMVAIVLLAGVIGIGYFFSRYTVAEETIVDLYEFPTFKYADDPSGRSPYYSEYGGRQLKLKQLDETHFDFIFEPLDEHVAKVAFKNVDVSLLTVNIPEYAKEDDGLRRIALTDREWNRQQVQFYVGNDNVEVTGGDGFEQKNLKVASLARNCLNAGLWELLLFTKTETGKEMYYQGWFSFPIGQYKRLWEKNNGLSYWDDFNFYRMEHWLDPAGNVLPMEKLRTVVSESEIDAKFDPDEPIPFAGEQIRKRRTTQAPGVRTWGDVIEKRDDIQLATFYPPGYYDVQKPWHNRYDLIAEFEGATHRRIKSLHGGEELDELQLTFKSIDGKESRLFIGGVDLSKVPAAAPEDYPKGLYLPMGIGTPPFYQDYSVLKKNPPQDSPYYSFFLDENNGWIDHHTMAVDGPILHRDAENPDLLHLYLMSYERHLLVAHYVLPIPVEPVRINDARLKFVSVASCRRQLQSTFQTTAAGCHRYEAVA